MGSLDRSQLDRLVTIDATWIGELDRGLGWNDKPRTYRLLNAVLHAVRESLQNQGTADDGAAFPVRLCGTRLDDWRSPLAAAPSGRTRDFIDRVALGFKPDPLADPTSAILAVVGLLSGKVAERGMGVLRRGVPNELQAAARGTECP